MAKGKTSQTKERKRKSADVIPSWHSSFVYPVQFSDEGRDEILDVLCKAGCECTDHPWVWSAVRWEIAMLRGRLNREQPRPISEKKLRDQLDKVAKRAQALRDALGEMHPATSDALEQSYDLTVGRGTWHEWGILYKKLKSLQQAAETVSIETRESRQAPDPGPHSTVTLRAGRRHPVKWHLLGVLANMFREFTGDAPTVSGANFDLFHQYEGHFPDFVRTVWSVATRDTSAGELPESYIRDVCLHGRPKWSPFVPVRMDPLVIRED